MSGKKLLTFGCITAVLLAMAWFISNPIHLQSAEGDQPGVRQGLAPSGATTSSLGQTNTSTDPITPVSVDLSEIPPGQYVPNNMYERWLRGELKIESEYRVSEREAAELQLAALDLAPNANIQILESEPNLNAPSPGVAFDSLDYTECCGGGGSTPPDSDLAVGPNHLIAAVNLAFEIYDKSGVSLLGPTTYASFFAPEANCTGEFDPTIAYDDEADRFSIGVDGNGTHFCIAVSQTNDPTGTWNIYAIPTQPAGVNTFHDYPHIGVGDEYIVMGGNQFADSGLACGGTFEGRVWALNKNDMYSGGALTPVTFDTGCEGTPQPLYLHGYNQGTWPAYGATHYFATDTYDGCTANIWQWDIPAAPSIVSTIDLCAATGVPAGLPIAWPQSGGSTIQGNDWRMRGFEFRNGSGWLADSISCNPGGGTVNCVRWSEIDLLNTPNPALVQAGVFASDNEYRTFPDLAVNQCNDVAVGYTKGSSATFPSVWYTGRESGDPVGTMQAEALLKAGEVTYTSFDSAPYRWGDYSGMTIDPDGKTFWYLGEYSKDLPGAVTKWGNYIGAFDFASCVTGDPDIEVDPTNLYSTQSANTIVAQTLTISNVGNAPLDWAIFETNGTLLDNMTDVSDRGSTTNNMDFPRGNYPPANGAPPSDGRSSAQTTAPLAQLLLSNNAYATENVLGHFIQYNLGAPEVLNDVITLTQSIWAGDFVTGDYAKTYNIKDDNTLVSINTTTGVETVIGALPTPPGTHTYTGMAYDPSTGTMFATSCDISASILYTIDLTTPSTTQVGPITGSPCTISLASDDIGNLYGVDIVNDELISINPATGAGTVIGSLNYDANFGQGADWDSSTGQLYLSAFNSGDFRAELRIANTSTGNTTLVGVLGEIAPGGGQLTQLGWTAIAYDGCSTPSDIPFLNVNPAFGTTDPGNASMIDIVFDSTGYSIGVYTGTLCIDSNDIFEPVVRVPITMTVPAYGVQIESSQAITAMAGETITYTLTVTNTGDVSDVFELSLSGNTWITMLSDTTVTLDPDEAIIIEVTVAIPAGTNDVDTVTITATSQSDTAATDSVTLTTTAESPNIYLPIVMKP